MRIPKTAHTSRPWRIHEIAPDFAVEDVWLLPAPGEAGDLPAFVRYMTSPDGDGEGFTGPAGWLFAIRWKLGEWFGWDKTGAGIGGWVATLRDRIPDDMRDAPRGPDSVNLPFKSIYLLDDEWAAELANKTVHGVMHIGWVEGDDGVHRAQMTVLVRPNGWFGKAYMAAILPFRYAVVYPAMMRLIGRGWANARPA
ncbi:MAG TPA: DUF2867 domain-containing protein [Phytomonospora sp.]